MMNCHYSIIIPHKNIPALLQRCLDSIPSREDIQIIVVDDNSSSTEVNFTKFPGNNRKDVVRDMLVIVVCLLLKVNGCCLLMLTIFLYLDF